MNDRKPPIESMEVARASVRGNTALPLDYLDDEVASAFFNAREFEAYYRSLKLADERRAFHNQLRPVLVRLLRLTDDADLRQLSELISRISHDKEAEGSTAIRDSPTQRVRRIEPKGMSLLGDDAGLDLERLRTSYRAAALAYHPDRGGTHEQMTAVNRAYEQLHRILVEEGNYEVPWASDEMASAAAYLWAVRRLLFDIALDEWALDDAAPLLDVLGSDDQLCREDKGGRLVDMIEPACKLTERLCAAGSTDGARLSLEIARKGLRMAQARGLNYDGYVCQAGEVVLGTRKPHFVLNSVRQIENAFRLGAIDKKRYEANLARLADKQAQKGTSRSERRTRLAQTKFIASLPIDAGLKPSHAITGLVPQPDYFAYRANRLTRDQQTEYLTTFRDGADLDLVAKYSFVRLSSLLRSPIFFPDACDLPSLLAETERLAQLEPRCAWYANGVRNVLGYIWSLKGSQRADYVEELARLLEPAPQRALIIMPNFPIDLTGGFFESARELAHKYGSAS